MVSGHLHVTQVISNYIEKQIVKTLERVSQYTYLHNTLSHLIRHPTHSQMVKNRAKESTVTKKKKTLIKLT